MFCSCCCCGWNPRKLPIASNCLSSGGTGGGASFFWALFVRQSNQNLTWYPSASTIFGWKFPFRISFPGSFVFTTTNHLFVGIGEAPSAISNVSLTTSCISHGTGSFVAAILLCRIRITSTSVAERGIPLTMHLYTV